jgi:hypothetical protein
MKAEVSLACSQATIHLPRTTAKGMPSSPTLLSRAPRQQGGTGSPKHPLSVDPAHGKRNHAPDRTNAPFSSPHNGAQPQDHSERQSVEGGIDW